MQPSVDNLPLIRWIPPDRRSNTLVVRHYHAGERVFSQGEPTTGLWLVLQGRVAVERVEIDGTLTTTGVWVTGDIVGIAGLWDQSGYPASARVLEEPTQLGWIARAQVLQLHQEIPEFGLEVSRLLSERLRFVQESHSGRQGRPMVNQVAYVLLTLSKRMGSSIALTHEDLARIIGTHRETVSRCLQELSRNGMVRSGHGVIEIVDASQLEEWTVALGR